MDFNKLKEDNGLFSYETNNFVSNYGKLYFRIESDLKTMLTCRVLNNMLIEENNLLGKRNEIMKKMRILYGVGIDFHNETVGGQLFNVVDYEYLDGSIVLDDYSQDAYNFMSALISDVAITEENMNVGKKKVLVNIKNSLMDKDRLVNSIFYGIELNDSLMSRIMCSDIDLITEILDSITLEDVRSMHETLYSDKSFYRGYVFGRYNEDEYKKMRSAFPYKSTMEQLDYSDTSITSNEDIEIENDSFNESIIKVTYRYTGNNYNFSKSLARMLNTSMGLLHLILRDKYGLVYTSNVVTRLNNDLIVVTAKIDKTKKEETLDAIDEVFEILQDKNKVMEYFEAIKLYLSETIDTFGEDQKVFDDYLKQYILKNGNSYDIFEYYKFVCNYDAQEFIEELGSLEKVNSFFYKGVK